MNSPFAEMSYSSSGLNIVPERLLLATRRPSTHHPLASGAAFFDPLRAICRRATNHLQHTAQHLATPPASHLPSFCAAPGDPLHSIRHLAARHPLAPAQHPSAPCTPSARQLTVQCPSTSPQTTRQRTAQHLLSLCKPPAVVLRNRWWLPASHLSMHHAPPSVAPPGAASAVSPRTTRLLLAQHPLTQADALIPLRTNRQREPTP